MTTSAQQLNRFYKACDKLINEKYMVADTRIEEVLRSIAECRALTDLFSAAAERFDYPAAKKMYLRFPASPTSSHGKAFLPKDRGEAIAFVFCILVDLDAGRLKMDDFLLRYFYEDGSYTASYALFSERMLRPFRDIVKECFPHIQESEKPETAAQRARKRTASVEAFASLAIEERERLKSLPLSPVDASAGDMILSELINACGKNNIPQVKAFVAGYSYFLSALFIGGAEEFLKAGRRLE